MTEMFRVSRNLVRRGAIRCVVDHNRRKQNTASAKRMSYRFWRSPWQTANKNISDALGSVGILFD